MEFWSIDSIRLLVVADREFSQHFTNVFGNELIMAFQSGLSQP